jgi:hypothetical protein
MMLRKTTGHQSKNGKWAASFRVNAGKQISTTSVATQAEALHAVDILKLELVPQWARQFVFDHGLNRPREIIEHYKSTNSLLMRSILYTKRARRQEQDKRAPFKSRILTTVPFKEASKLPYSYQIIHLTLKKMYLFTTKDQKERKSTF